jgi:hypothetical protein
MRHAFTEKLKRGPYALAGFAAWKPAALIGNAQRRQPETRGGDAGNRPVVCAGDVMAILDQACGWMSGISEVTECGAP